MLAALPDAVVSISKVAAAVAAAALLVAALYGLLKLLGRRSELARDLVRRAYKPTQLIATLGAAQAVIYLKDNGTWRAPVQHGLWLAIITGTAWLVAELLLVLEETALDRLRLDVRDNLSARRILTQVNVVRRITLAAIAVLAVAAMLMTFPEARAAGAALLTSAGLVGILTAFAAQRLLGNLFAGLQLAFGDALRLDDVVVVEGEWGRVEDMTLSYVVVKIWDERRLILPTSYFTSTPFENWTRTSASVLGTVELDVDWSIPVDAMRAELRRLVEGSDLWDGRVCALQVTDATGNRIRVRPLVSAADSSALWDLRCMVRERMVAWVRQEHPTALPRTRAELASGEGPAPGWADQPRVRARRADSGAERTPPVEAPH